MRQESTIRDSGPWPLRSQEAKEENRCEQKETRTITCQLGKADKIAGWLMRLRLVSG